MSRRAQRRIGIGDKAHGLGESDERGLHLLLREIEGAVGGATRHLHVDDAFGEVVAADQLLMHPVQLFAGRGPVHAKLLQGAAEAFHVGGIVHEPAVHHGADLINTIGEQEAAIEDRDFSFRFREILAVDVDGADHATGFLRGSQPLSTIPTAESMGVVAAPAGG
jgi:hypothetical protein